jgi:hypothetical protein
VAFISQNNVDGQYETWIDGVTIRGKDYDKVERIASEVALHRAWKTRVEESLDQHERQPPGWGGPEIAVWCLLCMVACIVVSAGINIGWWLWNG